MTRYVVGRLVQAIPTVLLASMLVFAMLHLMRGDVADVYFGTSPSRSAESDAVLRAQLGLDQPLSVQYLTWLGKAVRGDLGESWRFQQPVLALVGQRIQLSFELVGIASLISIVFSLILGIYLATHQNSVADQLIRFISLIFLSAPLYWVALFLIVALSRIFHWIPPLQYVTLAQNPLKHLQIIVMPATLWGIMSVPSFSRFVRNAMLDILNADYVRTARAKGLAERRVLLVHALRNASGPLATVVGLSFAGAAGGSVLLEVVFTLPGMGRLFLSAISQRDYPVIMGVSTVIAVVFVLVNLLTDLSYAWLDPRVRLE